MEPEKKIPEAGSGGSDPTYNIRDTVDTLHDEGVDILDDERVPDSLEYPPQAAPKAPPVPPRFASPAPQPAAAPAWMPSASSFVSMKPAPAPTPAQQAPEAPSVPVVPQPMAIQPVTPPAPAPVQAAPQAVSPSPEPASQPEPQPMSQPAVQSAPQPAPEPVAAARPVPPQPGPAPIAHQPIDMAAPARSAQSDIDMILGGGLGGSKTPPAGPEVRNDPSIKPLRTFKTDAEEAIRYQNISAAQIAMAEQKKKEEAAAAKPQPGQTADREGGGSRAGLVLIPLFLFALVGGGGYYYWFYMRTDAPASTPRVPAGLKVSSLVPYDAADIVTIGQNDDAIASIALKLASAPIQIGQTFVAVPVPTGTTTVKAEIASVLSNTRIPPMLERSLATEYTVGTRLFNANSPFLVFKNTFFQNAYAGMLEWERTMRSDFSALIRVAHPDEPAVDTSSAAFVDSVVSNIDARVLRNAAGQTVLAYAFADRDTAVIAMDEETLAYVLDKLLAVRIVQ